MCVRRNNQKRLKSIAVTKTITYIIFVLLSNNSQHITKINLISFIFVR